MANQANQTGYQPRNTPAERRAFFDLRRRLAVLEADGGGGGDGDLPPGGTTNQVLAKQSATDFDVYWAPPGISQAAADARYVNTLGDTMTGDLVLAADPNAPLEAATKQYVDGLVASASKFPYRWSTTVTMAEPGSGNVRANNITPNLATQLALSLYDSNGAARVALLELKAYDVLAFYVDDNLSSWIRYRVASAPMNNANSWISVPVDVVAVGGAGYAPTNNTPVQMHITPADAPAEEQEPWPVGSVYVSVLATAPPFGGTWVAIDPGAAIAVNSPATITLYYWERTA